MRVRRVSSILVHLHADVRQSGRKYSKIAVAPFLYICMLD